MQRTRKAREKQGSPRRYWAIHDPDEHWRDLARKAIRRNRDRLHPNEAKDAGAFIRFLLVNADQCVKGARPAAVSK